MGGGDLNLKKSWHPQTMKNQERVWKAEQADAAEKRKVFELQREIQNERDREELKRIGQSSGVLRSGGDDKKLEWMYKGQSLNREDYLTGRAVDKHFEQEDSKEKETAAFGITVPKNHVEHECIPFSIRNFKDAQMTTEQVDLQRKIMEDPLMAIKQRELETRKKLLSNPVKLKEIHRLLQTDKDLEGKSSKNKNKKKSKKKSSKKKKKRSKSSSDDTLSDSSNEDLDTKIAKKYKQIHGEIGNGKNVDGDKINFDKFLEQKYQKLYSELDKIKKSKQKDKGDSKNKKNNRKRSGSDSDERESNRQKDSGKNSPDEKRRMPHDRRNVRRSPRRSAERDRNERNRRDSRSPDRHARNRRNSRSPLAYRDNRRRFNQGSYFDNKRDFNYRRRPRSRDNYNQNRDRLLNKEDRSRSRSRNRGRNERDSRREKQSDSKYRSASRSSRAARKSRSRSPVHSNIEKDRKNIRKSRSTSPLRRLEKSKEIKTNKTRSRSRSATPDIKQKSETIKKPEITLKENDYSKSVPSTSQQAHTEVTKQKSRSRSTSSSSSSTSSTDGSNDSPPNKTNADSDNERPTRKNFGLVTADGKKIELKRKHENVRDEASIAAKKPDQPALLPPSSAPSKSRKKLTEKEKKELLRQMQDNAKWRDVERERSYLRDKEENKRESEQQQTEFDRNYIHKELHKALNNQDSVEARIKSNVNNIQRANSSMNSSFIKR